MELIQEFRKFYCPIRWTNWVFFSKHHWKKPSLLNLQRARKSFHWVLLSLKLTNHLIKSFKEAVLVLSAPRLPLSAHSFLTPPFLLLCRALALWGRSGCSTCPRAGWTCSGWQTHRGTCFCTWERDGKRKKVSMSVLTHAVILAEKSSATSPRSKSTCMYV